MKTRISTKGQVVIPRVVRQKLELRPGDTFETQIEGDHIILVPTRKRTRKFRLARSPRTGLPILTPGRNAPRLTSEQVAEMLADFP